MNNTRLWTPTLATRAALGIKADLANAGQPIVVNVIGPANVVVEGSLRANYAKILYRGVEYIVPVSTLDFPVTEVVSAGEHLRGGV